ncbi:MAG: 4-(cytidine 5'-diphospho)-2-C-methyl-D-erythritol kinase [Chlamydiota bacterium]
MITLLSPAKINLFLKIISRRDDGYHELASLFQAVSLFDTLTFKRCEEKDRLNCSDPEIPVDDRNLVIQAVNLFRKESGLDFFVDIDLDKQIPSQAGLGGGSSNAATTLWALNEMFGKPVTLPVLKSWGTKLGSDVPFFLSTGTAFCQGRGEVMKDLGPLKISSKFVLTKPSFGMSTADVYRNLDISRFQERDLLNDLNTFLGGDGVYFNDLEEPAFRLSPELLSFKQSLKAEQVLMSGSGSAFFCVGDKVSIPCGTWQTKVSPVNRQATGWYTHGCVA